MPVVAIAVIVGPVAVVAGAVVNIVVVGIPQCVA